MKFQLKNYEDYILFNQLEKAKELAKTSPIIKEEKTKIRANATYYEFEIKDDDIYNVDIVVENGFEVTVNRCSCGSIACSHLACCYAKILADSNIENNNTNISNIDNERTNLINKAIKNLPQQKPFSYLLSFMNNNCPELKGWMHDWLSAVIPNPIVVSFDYTSRKLLVQLVEQMERNHYLDDEVYRIFLFMINNFVNAYGNYKMEFSNLLIKKYAIVYYALSFSYGQYNRMNRSSLVRCYNLFNVLNLKQKAFEFAIKYQMDDLSLEYPYQEIFDFVINDKPFVPFDLKLIENIDELILAIYETNTDAAITIMDFFGVFVDVDFGLQDIIENPQFYAINYPDKTKSVLDIHIEDYLFSSVSEVEKIIEVAKSFGDEYFQEFINMQSSEFFNTLLCGKDTYLTITKELPFSIDKLMYYNFFPGKNYLMVIKPAINRKGDDIIAVEVDNLQAEHIIYLDEKHQIMGAKCYRCGHNTRPCIHESSIIHLLNSFAVSSELANQYQLINQDIEAKRETALKKFRKKDALKRINAYEERFINLDDGLLSQKVDIIPTISLNRYINNVEEYSINFRICHGNVSYRLYPTKFNQAMENGENYVYGKKLQFRHVLENFTERAKIIYNTISYARETDYIQLSASRLASLLLSLKEFGVEIDGSPYVYRGNYELQLKITHNNTLEILEKDKLKGKFLFTPSHDFYFDNGEYFIIDYPNEKQKIIIQDIIENGELSLDELEDDFINKLYPFLRRQIIMDKEFAQNNHLEQLIIKAYFDFDEGAIKVDYRFEINSELINIDMLTDAQKLETKPFLMELERLKFKDNILSKSEDIISFTNSDLKVLREEATIYITNRLKRLFEHSSFNAKMVVNKKTESILDIYFTDLDYTEDELYSIYQAYKKHQNYILLNDRIINLKNIGIKDFVDMADELEMKPNALLHHYENPLHSLFKMQSSSVTFDLSTEVKNLITELKNYQKNEFPIKDELLIQMRPYQLNGFKWMRLLLSKGLGCILADDMGIGKTLQTIAVIDSFSFDKPCLVVCPKNIIYNWEAEVNKWAPWLNAKVIIGNKQERLALFAESFKTKTDIVIASYETIRIEENYLQDQWWSLVILDEAQNIKNPMVERTKAVKKLHCDYRLALTGTPIENSLSDAWSIFDFLMPGYLYKYQRFVAEIERQENFQLLQKKLLPFVLRRTKGEVLKELPKKTEELVYIAFEEKEAKLYQSELLHARMQMEANPDNRMRVLASIMQLREICVDPRLVYDSYHDIGSKTETVLEMLNNLLANGHKVLIFSQFVKYLDLLSNHLKEKNINHHMLTGQTSALTRQEMADDFNKNEDKKVFLVSLKAGGVGLNLIGADIVIHVDPWWNYAIESQASDRAYRIGQTKPVTIYKIVMKNSIEEKVIKLQEYKKRLGAEVINENDEMMSKLSIKDFEALLK